MWQHVGGMPHAYRCEPALWDLPQKTLSAVKNARRRRLGLGLLVVPRVQYRRRVDNCILELKGLLFTACAHKLEVHPQIQHLQMR